jgi:hypothetical protein
MKIKIKMSPHPGRLRNIPKAALTNSLAAMVSEAMRLALAI